MNVAAGWPINVVTLMTYWHICKEFLDCIKQFEINRRSLKLHTKISCFQHHTSSTQYITRGLTLSRVGNGILVTTTIVNRSRSLVINNRFAQDTWRYLEKNITDSYRGPRFEKYPKETCYQLYKKMIDYSYRSLPPCCVPRSEFIATILNDLTTFELIFVPRFELQAVWS